MYAMEIVTLETGRAMRREGAIRQYMTVHPVHESVGSD